MSKKIYTVILDKDCDEDEFVAHGDGSRFEINSRLENLRGVLSFKLTEEEVAELSLSEDVLDIQEELKTVPTYAFQSPRSQTTRFITRYYPSTATLGSSYSSTHFYYTSDFKLENPELNEPLGYFTSAGEGTTSTTQYIKQNFAGATVDIVAIEAADNFSSTYDNYVNHPDFLDDEGNTRFVKMDWSDYDGSLNNTENNQISNNTLFLGPHAIGVLSVAGGLYCGWAKVSSLRVIYLTDGVSAAYNAVLAWHNSKPINPVTGKRNATITTGSWGFIALTHIRAIPVDEVTVINAYDADGNLSVINRPGGGWGNDFTPFTNNLIVPRVIRDPADNTDKWMISVPNTSRYTTIDVILNNYNSAGGIYHFKSAGNDCHVAAKPTDPRWNTNIQTESSTSYISISYPSDLFDFTNASSGSRTEYPLRTYENGSTNGFTIGASQHSTVNPLPDDYSARGPFIDFWGLGAETWTAYPAYGYADSFSWGYFSGTSCAAPNVAGVAAVMVDWWFSKYGVYPTTTQLRTLMSDSAKAVIVGEELVDFSSTPTATNFASSRLYFTSDVHRITEGSTPNGATALSDLYGSTTKRANLPYKIVLGTGKYISVVRTDFLGSRPSSGQAYPRRKLRLASS